MSVEEKLKDLFAEIKHLNISNRYASKRYPKPADTALWLDEVEEYAHNLSNEIPQKERILRGVKTSRALLVNGNEDELRHFIYVIYRHCKVAEENIPVVNMNAKLEEDRERNSNSGRADKKRYWAIETARMLLNEGHNTEDEAWKGIPDGHSWLEVEVEKPTNAEYEVYRDGMTLVGRNTETGNVQTLKKGSFFKSYYRKEKNSGK